MTEFRFFYGLNLAHKVYLLTDNLSKTLQKKSMSAIEGQETAGKTLKTFEKMRTTNSADIFYEAILKKASMFDFVNDPVLPRKRKDPNYRSLNEFFVVEGHSSNIQAHFVFAKGTLKLRTS